MAKKSTYIGLIIGIGVFFLVMFLFFGIDNIKKESYNLTLIVGDNTVWMYNKKNWVNVSEQESFKDLSWKKYDVYSNNIKQGVYTLWHDDKWYAFDDNKNAVTIDGDFLAVASNFKIDISNFNTQNIEVDDNIYTVLNDNSLNTSSMFTSKYKVDIDLDDDGLKEEIYVISNAFSMDFNPNKIFSIVFMVKDKKIYYLYNNIIDNNKSNFNGCKPYINSILDIDNDNKYEIILSCSKYSVGKRVDMLYQFVDGQFKLLISNQ